MGRFATTTAFLLLIGGCATPGVESPPPAYAVLAPGAGLQLQETLTIDPHLARVYLQHGKVVEKIRVDIYRPNCYLKSYRVPNHAQVIQPDNFQVLNIEDDTELVLGEHIMLASSLGLGFGLFDDGLGPMAEIFTTTFYITSILNPDIERLQCQAWRNLNFGKHLSVAEIQEALGEKMQINVGPPLSRAEQESARQSDR